MATGIVIARQLGPELRGYYGLVIYAVNLIHLGHLGLGPSITYHTGRNEKQRGKILTFTVSSAFLLGTTLAITFYFVYPHIPGIWTDISPSVMMIGLLSIPFFFLINYLNSFLIGMLKIRQSNLVNLLRVFSNLVLVLILVWAMSGKIREASICFTSSMIIASMLGLILFTRKIKPARIEHPSFLKPFLRYGLKAYAISICAFINYRLDIFLIKHFLTASDVGFYQIAVNISERLWYVPNALGYMLLPTLLSMQKGSAGFTAKVCRNSLLAVLIIAIALILTGKYLIVLLYGEAYLPSVMALYSVMWGIVVVSVYKILGAYFASENRLGITIFASVIGIVVNILANLYMIPHYGIVGAGIATSLSYTILSLILVVFFLRQTDIKLKTLFIPNREDYENLREGFKKLLSRLRREKAEDSESALPFIDNLE